jgi:hypothetical protein
MWYATDLYEILEDDTPLPSEVLIEADNINYADKILEDTFGADTGRYHPLAEDGDIFSSEYYWDLTSAKGDHTTRIIFRDGRDITITPSMLP